MIVRRPKIFEAKKAFSLSIYRFVSRIATIASLANRISQHKICVSKGSSSSLKTFPFVNMCNRFPNFLKSIATLVCYGLVMNAPYGVKGESDHQHERQTLIQGAYRTGEAVSKQMFFSPGQRLRVQWLAKPAIGNCVVSLFSIFNADLLFDYSVPESLRPRWSEIAIETFGGSVNSAMKQFQTQYITQSDPNDSPTQRGKQHLKNHFLPNVTNIYDGNFHLFEIDFRAAAPGIDAQIQYIIDGKRIRKNVGKDANYIEPPLDLYAGVWVTSTTSTWGCTSTMARPTSAAVVIKSIKVDEYVGTTWETRKLFTFTNGISSVYNDWNLSNWGFESFDGAFDPSAVTVNSTDSTMVLSAIRN